MHKLSVILVMCLLLFTTLVASEILPPKNVEYVPVSIDPAKYFQPQEKSEPKDPAIQQVSNVAEVVPPLPIPSEDNRIKDDRQAISSPPENYREDPDIYEPDNFYWEATTLSINAGMQIQYHTFHVAGDEDWYSFYGVQGVRYVFFSTQPDGWADPRVYLYDALTISLIAQDDNSGLYGGFFLEFTPTSSDYYLLLVNNTGFPGEYYFYYTNGTPADEYENDSTSGQATVVNPSGIYIKQLHTLHNSSDLDWFVFNAHAGTTYNFYTEGSLDTYGRIYAANGTTIVAFDDDAGVGLNFSISFNCTTTGTYYLRIHGYGGATGFYILRFHTTAPPDAYEPDNTYATSNYLTVTSIPQIRDHTLHNGDDEDWFRFYAYTGRRYVFYTSSYNDPDVTLYDDALNEIYEDLTNGDFLMYFEPPANGFYGFRIRSLFSAPFAYQLMFYYEFDPDSYEPDNTASTATNITTTTIPQTQNHTLHNGYDQDWYKFEGIPGRLYFFYSTGSTDTQIYLYADDGTTQLGFNDDSGEGFNYRLEFAPATYGYYKLKVIPYPGNAGPYGFVYYYGATPDAYEPDNVYSVSTTLIPTTDFQSQPHTLHDGTDEDWFIFYAYGGRTYTFYSTGNTDVRAYFYNAELNQFGFNDDGAGYPNFLLQYYITNPGLLYIKVNGYNGAVGAYDINYNYTLGSLPPPLYVSIVLINDNTIYLDWPNVINATSYRVEGSDNPYSGFVPVATVSSSSWSTSTTYAKKFYRVIAIN